MTIRSTPASVLFRYRITIDEIIGHFVPDAAGPYSARLDDNAVIIDIERPGLPVEGPQTPPVGASNAEPLKGGPIAQRAGILCAQGGFRAFLGVKTEADAADHIRRACAIASRVELDHDKGAAGRFAEIEGNYDLWLKGYD